MKWNVVGATAPDVVLPSNLAGQKLVEGSMSLSSSSHIPPGVFAEIQFYELAGVGMRHLLVIGSTVHGEDAGT